MIWPIVETGMRRPLPTIWPEGKVRLFAASTPVTCAAVTPLASIFLGSSVMTTCCSWPPDTSTDATPSRPSSAGAISLVTIEPASASEVLPLAATAATITGLALMFSALTCGVTLVGSFACWRFASIVALASLTSVP